MIGRRYSPLIVLAAVQLVLVLVAPSIPGGGSASTLVAGSGGVGGSGGAAAGSISSGGVGGAGGGGGGGTASGGGAGAGFDGSGGAGGSGTVAGGVNGTGGAAGQSGSVGATGPGASGGDRSDCTPSGRQIGPTFYMPVCVPVWHGGNNGGATMTGVYADHINYLYDNAQANAEVDAILEADGLAASQLQLCQALGAFNVEINKRWQFYGRKLVPLDGPGNNKGSTQQSGCSTPYFQSQCSITPPDPPCFRAEADEIAAMKPAIVIAPALDPSFYNEMAKDHIIVFGGQTEPDSYHQDDAPYYYDIFMNGTRDMQLTAEYYCNQLYGKPVQYAGSDVEHPDGIGSPPQRKLAIVYPETNGDPTYTISADYFIKLVSGGMCGSSSNGVKGFPYASDITTAEQQSTTIVAGLKASGVTTVVFFGDPIAPVFLSTTMAAQDYHPEILMTGIGLVDYDVLAQLYNSSVWQHAFGISTLADNIPFSDSDAVKAWQDAGNSGEPDTTENLNWSYFSAVATAFQLAGPDVTPESIQQGLFTALPLGGDPLHTLQEFGRPDDYTSLRDARIVYYCANVRSPINNAPGSYVAVNGGQRYQVGQIPTTPLAVFPHGAC
jgi:hypothetical protein